jgi:hypothetical protein
MISLRAKKTRLTKLFRSLTWLVCGANHQRLTPGIAGLCGGFISHILSVAKQANFVTARCQYVTALKSIQATRTKPRPPLKKENSVLFFRGISSLAKNRDKASSSVADLLVSHSQTTSTR